MCQVVHMVKLACWTASMKGFQTPPVWTIQQQNKTTGEAQWGKKGQTISDLNTSMKEEMLPLQLRSSFP